MKRKVLKITMITGLSLVFGLLAWITGYYRGSINASIEHSSALKEQRARMHLFQLSQSISNYHRLTGKWPCKRNGQADFTFGPGSQKEVVGFLLEQIAGTPQDYLMVDLNAIQGEEVIDPWGKPYYIVFDTDNDGNCRTERWGVLQGSGPYVWTEGTGIVSSWALEK